VKRPSQKRILCAHALQGIKQNEFETLFEKYCYRVIAIVRNPIDTIASRNSPD